MRLRLALLLTVTVIVVVSLILVINPLEKIREGKDAQTYSDAVSLLNQMNQFYIAQNPPKYPDNTDPRFHIEPVAGDIPGISVCFYPTAHSTKDRSAICVR